MRLVDDNGLVPAAGRRLGVTTRSGEGRVEVFHDGEWGTICSTYFGMADANVVCSQLGFSKAVSYSSDATYGRGTA